MARRAWLGEEGERRWEGWGVLSPGVWAAPMANPCQSVRCAGLREIRVRPQEVAPPAICEEVLSRLQRYSGGPLGRAVSLGAGLGGDPRSSGRGGTAPVHGGAGQKER